MGGRGRVGLVPGTPFRTRFNELLFVSIALMLMEISMDFDFVPAFSNNPFQNSDKNLGSRSEMIVIGNPHAGYTVCQNFIAQSDAVYMYSSLNGS